MKTPDDETAEARRKLRDAVVSERESLSAVKRELLARRLRRRQGGEARQKEAAAVIPRRPEGGAPLSLAQERLWFLGQLEPASTAYNMPFQLHFDGALDAAVLERSFREVVRRHEVLRTTYPSQGGRPSLVVHPPPVRLLPSIDLGGLPDATRRRELQRLTDRAERRKLDLARGPVFEAGLVRLAREEHVLILVIHHIVFDGWSADVLLREMTALYAALATGRPSPLPELPLQYADFAYWQRQTLGGELLERQIGYWRGQLTGAPATLGLPADAPGGADDGTAGWESRTLDAALAGRLKALGRQEGASLFMVLLAAWKLLLSRLAGEDDVVVGTPSAGRTRRELEPLVGFFLNTLVLRTRLDGEPSFRQLLGRVRDVTLQAFAHQDVSFAKLVEELRPQRDLDRPPFFEVMFNFLNTPAAPSPAAAELHLRLRLEQVRHVEGKLPWNLYGAEQDGTVSFSLVYKRSLFRAETVRNVLEEYEAVLSQVAARPDEPIAAASLVTPRWRRLAAEGLLGDPTVELPAAFHPSVPESLAYWTARQGDAPAVSQGERTWTYAELTAASGAIARRLRRLGLGGGDVVAVEGERSFGLIAAMAAVLESRLVLLPLDPRLPARRRRLLLEQAGARALLAAGRSGEAAIHRLDVESTNGRLPPAADDAPVGVPAPEDPAYVFFTSGTTGRPKGVLGSHRGLSHFLDWQRRRFEVGPGDRGAQMTGLSFDVVLRDVFLALTSGATLCLPAAGADVTAPETLTWLEDEGVTFFHCVPAVAQGWLAAGEPEVALRSLRWVFFAGEPLTEALVRRWRRAFPAGAVVNLYGPTETTLAKCCYVVPDVPDPGVQPLGRPLPGAQALVLTPEGRLCGLAEPGEIVIRTPFRSLGTLGGDGTERRFFPNPFRDDERDLLYPTGDRGRYRGDGCLEILGRLDHQLKVRGVRVEPGEVEAALLEHEAVRACAVLGVKGDDGESRLVACVVPVAGTAPTETALRAFLGRRLPMAMVPTAWTLLDRLPLTPNGKVDRRALEREIRSLAAAGGDGTAMEPRDLLELRLLRIWEELLGKTGFGVRDDFFHLGGHSLLAARLMARLRDELGHELPLAAIFEAADVERMAALLRHRAPDPYEPLVALRAEGSRPPFFCIHPGGGGVVCYAELARQLGPEQPFYALQARGLRSGEEPLDDVGEMARLYLEAIRGRQPHGPYRLGGWSFGGRVALEVAQLFHSRGEEVELLAIFDTDLLLAEKAAGLPADEIAWRIAFLEEFAGGLLPGSAEELRGRDPEELLREMLERAKAAGRLPPDVAPRDVRRLLEVFKTHARATHRYRPQPYAGRVVLFRAVDEGEREATLGWSRMASGLEVHPVSGRHNDMVLAPHAEALAALLGSYLA